MSCPYYTWRSDYYCVKKKDYVREDIYYKYCRNYDYDDCPIYRDEGEVSGGCFLSSACIETMGLPDNCQELTILRKFRDEWLFRQPGGENEIKEYYKIAPSIVSSINKETDRKDVFKKIYEDLVAPSVVLIQEGRRKDAWILYKQIVMKLKEKYIK